MAFPDGYGLWGSCKFCPSRTKCEQGKHCKIFTNIKPAPKKYVYRTRHENYTLSDLLLLGVVWFMRISVAVLIVVLIVETLKYRGYICR